MEILLARARCESSVADVDGETVREVVTVVVSNDTKLIPVQIGSQVNTEVVAPRSYI